MSALTALIGRGADTVLSRHNLRRRIAAAVGALTMVSVLVFGVAVWIVVAVSLRSATDDDLRRTAALFNQLGPERLQAELTDDQQPGLGPDSGLLPTGADRPPVPFIQVIDEQGNSQGSDLPVSAEARAVAGGSSTEHLEDVTLDDRSIRVLTTPAVGLDGRAIRIGTDFSNAVQGLRRARAGTVLAGLLAGLAAALTAWLGAGRLIAPVSAVAKAADDLRREDNLPERLEGEGEDELGRLVGSFNALLDDLQKSRDRQRRLVADASHELRTPLTSLRVKTEFIQSQPGLAAEERQSLLDGAVADLDSLGDLVSELVELAAEGASSERPRLVELADVVTAEVERFRVSSGRTVELVVNPGMVETRPKQITRALSNLLVNADKYSPPDGAITVTQRGPAIEVRDHGPGIPASDRDRAFDRFFRGKGHQSIEGSGLGLAIVESVARSNGGRVWIGEPDQGPGAVVGFTVGPTAG
jgi:two-component system sensor histidine kinase MprB